MTGAGRVDKTHRSRVVSREPCVSHTDAATTIVHDASTDSALMTGRIVLCTRALASSRTSSVAVEETLRDTRATRAFSHFIVPIKDTRCTDSIDPAVGWSTYGIWQVVDLFHWRIRIETIISIDVRCNFSVETLRLSFNTFTCLFLSLSLYR